MLECAWRILDACVIVRNMVVIHTMSSEFGVIIRAKWKRWARPASTCVLLVRVLGDGIGR
jgi:hypothetical protein